jgi:uncharacterized lipoprotein YajG
MDDTRPRRALVCLALGFLAACGEDPVTPVTPPDPCDASDPIAMGQTVSGQLAVDDCESGTYLDR